MLPKVKYTGGGPPARKPSRPGGGSSSGAAGRLRKPQTSCFPVQSAGGRQTVGLTATRFSVGDAHDCVIVSRSGASPALRRSAFTRGRKMRFSIARTSFHASGYDHLPRSGKPAGFLSADGTQLCARLTV